MATRIFVSSTVADLKDVRASIIQELKDMGHHPVYFESEDFFVDPSLDTVEACLKMVESSHVLLLIIDRRFGSRYGPDKKSVTWEEYETARKKGIPIFTLVRKSTMYAWDTFRVNGESEDLRYPGVDETDVLRFLTHVASQEYGNWIRTFETPVDAMKWFKAQLSGMLEKSLVVSPQNTSADETENLATPTVVSCEDMPDSQTSLCTTSVSPAGQTSSNQALGSAECGENDESCPVDPVEAFNDIMSQLSYSQFARPEDSREIIDKITRFLLMWSVSMDHYISVLQQIPRPVFAGLPEEARRRAVRRLRESFNSSRGFNYRGKLAQLALRLIDSIPEDKLDAAAEMIIGSILDNEWATMRALREEIRTIGPIALRAIVTSLMNSERLSPEDIVSYIRLAAENPNVSIVGDRVEQFLNQHDPD